MFVWECRVPGLCALNYFGQLCRYAVEQLPRFVQFLLYIGRVVVQPRLYINKESKCRNETFHFFIKKHSICTVFSLESLYLQCFPTFCSVSLKFQKIGRAQRLVVAR